jgi:hypothetical protein
MKETKVRNNRFNIQWHYAKQCWDAIVAGDEVPPIPNYTIWETTDGKAERVIGQKQIVPMRVTCRGITVHG